MDHRRKQQQPQKPPAVGNGGATWKSRSHPGGGVGGGVGRGRSSFWCTLTVVLCCALLSALTFSTFRLFGVSFRPVLIATWQQSPTLRAVSSATSAGAPGVISALRHPSSPLLHHPAVAFPDQLLFFLPSPTTTTTTTAAAAAAADDDHATLRCLYLSPSHSSSRPGLRRPPFSVDLPHGIVRCPPHPRGFLVSLGDGGDPLMPPARPRRWDSLAYESLLDPRDNSTIVFVKGLNLRPERLSDASRYECVFGWDFARPRYLLSADALSVAQEIVRCRTPLSVLRRHYSEAVTAPPRTRRARSSVMVSVKARGRGAHIMPSIARPAPIPRGGRKKEHRMCVCTMVRNQAQFMKEWILYHARIGVERWFIYDNNSNDSIEHIVRGMEDFNVTRHVWPWVKTQEAGFAHCALRARVSCEWVGFIDVDEFLYLPSAPEPALHDVLRNYSSGYPWVAELRTACHTFGPSGRRAPPRGGVTTGYTCRMAAPERHKSIVRPEALSSSLINVVHHFHLRDGFRYVNVDRGVMVINHYKYQAWEVFKEKFYRRVATYVADWQDKENEGSKDRAPGLGTRAVEPPDWPNRFCEVDDTGLRDRVRRIFADPETGQLPWWGVGFLLFVSNNCPSQSPHEDGVSGLLISAPWSRPFWSFGLAG